jgi:hypothetical protein
VPDPRRRVFSLSRVRPRPLAAFAGALVALAVLPGVAAATDYCVPTVAACPGAVGTAEPDLQSALDLADNLTDADRVFLAAGTFSAPTTAGFDYNLPTGRIDVIGAASSGAGKTTITTPANAARVLRLYGATGSMLAHVEIAVADNAAVSSTQLDVKSLAASDVAVVSSATQTNGYRGVELGADASFQDGNVSVSQSPNGVIALLLRSPGATIARTAISGRVGVQANASAVSASLDRLSITASSAGVESAGATLDLRSSLIVMSGPNCGLIAIDQPSHDGVLNANDVTVVEAVTGAIGVCADSINSAPRAAVVNVSNSILRVTNARSVFSNGTGNATANVSYSDFDPAGDLSAGVGPTTLSPPTGTLGATNVNVDPVFVGAADFRLTAGSPVLDLGDPLTAAGLDLDGKSLLFDGNGDCADRRDMGAYERQAGALPCPLPPPSPPPAPSGDPAPAIPALAPSGPKRDRVAPVITRLRVVRGQIRFNLSEAARVSVSLRPRHGRASTRALTGRKGLNRVAVPVRLRRRALALRLTATDAAGNRATKAKRIRA